MGSSFASSFCKRMNSLRNLAWKVLTAHLQVSCRQEMLGFGVWAWLGLGKLDGARFFHAGLGSGASCERRSSSHSCWRAQALSPRFDPEPVSAIETSVEVSAYYGTFRDVSRGGHVPNSENMEGNENEAMERTPKQHCVTPRGEGWVSLAIRVGVYPSRRRSAVRRVCPMLCRETGTVLLGWLFHHELSLPSFARSLSWRQVLPRRPSNKPTSSLGFSNCKETKKNRHRFDQLQNA